MNHYIDMWQRIFQFEGRTSRPGFWWPMLINILAGIAVGLIFSVMVESIYSVALTVATFTLTCRRLRDAGFQWYWALLRFAGLIPLLSALSLVPLVLCALPTKGPRYIDAA